MFWAAWISEVSIWPRPMKITERNSRPLLLCTEMMLGGMVCRHSNPSLCFVRIRLVRFHVAKDLVPQGFECLEVVCHCDSSMVW